LQEYESETYGESREHVLLLPGLREVREVEVRGPREWIEGSSEDLPMYAERLA
jgi:hypothetical protein